MAADPYLPLYTRDWRSDPRLRASSFAARGLWLEMMLLMHEAASKGYLMVGERRLTESDLAIIATQCGALGGAAEVKKLLTELRENGVYSVAEDGTIFSRRMVRDVEKRERDRQNGRKGGNPGLKARDNHGVNPPDNPSDNPGDKANARAPLAWVGYDLAPTQSAALAEMEPAYALGVWFVWAAVKAGAIPSHQEPFAERTGRNTLEIAAALLASHDLDEIRGRAARMFAKATVRGPERWRVVTLPMLFQRWDDFAEVGGAPAPVAVDTEDLDAYTRPGAVTR